MKKENTKKATNNTSTTKESENKEMKKENATKKSRQDLLLEEMQKTYKNYELIKAHGGVAVKINNKRAFEVCKKRDNTYKVCAHKNTTLTADLRNTQECEVQQNNYKFDNLSKAEMKFVCSELLKAKKTIIRETEKRNNEK